MVTSCKTGPGAQAPQAADRKHRQYGRTGKAFVPSSDSVGIDVQQAKPGARGARLCFVSSIAAQIPRPQ
jgi:hypothetical protein